MRPGFHRLHRQRDGAVTGKEDYRHFPAARFQRIGYLETVSARHAHIQNDTAGNGGKGV
ncbi:hypothetical protein D3C79_962680 [compost metagenome]